MRTSMTDARSSALDDGGYIVESDRLSNTAYLPDQESGTRSLSRVTRKTMLPLLFSLASVGGALPGVRRQFSDATASRSAISSRDNWLLLTETFYFTEEPADEAEVRALNALLELPTISGFELDLPE